LFSGLSFEFISDYIALIFIYNFDYLKEITSSDAEAPFEILMFSTKVEGRLLHSTQFQSTRFSMLHIASPPQILSNAYLLTKSQVPRLLSILSQ
jgi:hypothetical protein